MTSLISGFEKEINLKFPPILVLMNINGCLVHRTQEKINFLKQIPLFKSMNEHNLEKLASALVQEVIPKRAVIYAKNKEYNKS